MPKGASVISRVFTDLLEKYLTADAGAAKYLMFAWVAAPKTCPEIQYVEVARRFATRGNRHHCAVDGIGRPDHRPIGFEPRRSLPTCVRDQHYEECHILRRRGLQLIRDNGCEYRQPTRSIGDDMVSNCEYDHGRSV
jgi:hypothetical protein